MIINIKIEYNNHGSSMKLSNFVLPFVLIILLLNTALVLTMPFNFGFKREIELSIISEIKTALDTMFLEISERTDGDMVWVNLFHTNPTRDFVGTFGFRSEPLYQSAFHYWTRQGVPTPIRYRQNEPVLSLDQIQETFIGRCIYRVSSERDVGESETIGIPKERLIIRCPLFRNEIIVGTIGVTIFDYPIDNLKEYSEKRFEILREYADRIRNTIFNSNS